MEKTKMKLYGASGHGKVVKEIVESNGHIVDRFIDDNEDIESLMNVQVDHSYNGEGSVIVTIGDNGIRRKIVEKLCCKFDIAIHPSAVISPSAVIGEGTVIMAGVVINADTIIGKHCIINTGATIGHDCIVDDYCHIAPGAHVCGGCRIGEGTWIGVGTSVIQCRTIGKQCMIGAGSVVIKDIPDGMKSYGNPCKVQSANG